MGVVNLSLPARRGPGSNSYPALCRGLVIRRRQQRGVRQHPARHLIAEVAALLQALFRKLFGLRRGRFTAIYRCSFHATLCPTSGT